MSKLITINFLYKINDNTKYNIKIRISKEKKRKIQQLMSISTIVVRLQPNIKILYEIEENFFFLQRIRVKECMKGGEDHPFEYI